MAGLAGCQTRPIAEAHHKTHGDDAGSFPNSRGMSLEAPSFGSSFSRFLAVHFNHVQLVLQASSMEDLMLAPSLPPPVDRHLLIPTVGR
jgi:hypothetical protein